MLHETMSQTTQSAEMLPTFETFEDALSLARLPRPATVNGTVSGINLTIGSEEINPEEYICIPIKYSKATMKARPPSLSKAWKAAVDLQAPKIAGYRDQNASQLMSSLAQQSQSQAIGDNFDPSELAAMISAEVKQHSTYVIKRQPENGATQGATQGTQTQASQRPDADDDFIGLDAPTQEEPVEDDAEEEYVEKEDIVKAWRFGSTWVPMEADLFEPLETSKGVEVLNFIPIANVSVSPL